MKREVEAARERKERLQKEGEQVEGGVRIKRLETIEEEAARGEENEEGPMQAVRKDKEFGSKEDSQGGVRARGEARPTCNIHVLEKYEVAEMYEVSELTTSA